MSVPVPRLPLPFAQALASTLEGLSSPHSRRAYTRGICLFLEFARAKGSIDRAAFISWRASLEAQGLAVSTVSLYMAAVRAWVAECSSQGTVPREDAQQITTVPSPRKLGKRTGLWYTRAECEQLLLHVRSNHSPRDYALIAVLLGCGLRRAELTSLVVGQLQQREGRWVFADVQGKGGRVRTVPVPQFAAEALERHKAHTWVMRQTEADARLFPLTPSAIYQRVQKLTGEAGLLPATPHDLRRTFARLARSGGAPLEQIQFSLGHASVEVTQEYVGMEQDLASAPCDMLGLSTPKMPEAPPGSRPGSKAPHPKP